MKNIYVNEITEGQLLSNETFAVASVESKTAKNGKPFYKLVLKDKTGSIAGQIWSDNFESVNKKTLKEGNLVAIDANVNSFQNTLQLNIFKLDAVNESELDKYLESSAFDLDEMWSSIKTYIENIKNQNIINLLTDLFKEQEFFKHFKIAPAAESVHHAFRGGLMEHVLEMLDLAMALKKYYPLADFDLVVAGIVLHDIGKLYELDTNGVSIARTSQGYLIGHIVQGYELTLKLAEKYLTTEEALMLKHIILAHHGSLEFGSPIKPATIEAQIVSVVDYASSQVRIMQNLLNQSVNDDKDFTEYDRYLGVKAYKKYLHTNKSLNESTEQFPLT